MSGTSPIVRSIESLPIEKVGASARTPHVLRKSHLNHGKENSDATVRGEHEAASGKRIFRRTHKAADASLDFNIPDLKDFGRVFADVEKKGIPVQTAADTPLTLDVAATLPTEDKATSTEQPRSMDKKLDSPALTVMHMPLQIPLYHDRSGDNLKANPTAAEFEHGASVVVLEKRPDVSAKLGVNQDLTMHELTHQTGYDGKVKVTEMRSHWLFAGYTTNSPGAGGPLLQPIAAGTGNLLKPSSHEIGTPSRLQATNDTALSVTTIEKPNSWARADNGSQGDTNTGSHRGNANHQATSRASEASISAAPKTTDTANAESLSVLGSPGAQLSKGIVSELNDLVGQPHQTAAQAFISPLSVSGRVARSLKLTLEPANLGMVQVKLSLAGKELKIEVETANSDAARYLAEDRDHLDSSLRAVGLDLSSMTISVSQSEKVSATTQDPTGAPSPAASSNTDSDRNALLSSGSDSGAGRQSSHEQRSPRPLVDSGEGSGALSALIATDGKMLYV